MAPPASTGPSEPREGGKSILLDSMLIAIERGFEWLISDTRYSAADSQCDSLIIHHPVLSRAFAAGGVPALEVYRLWTGLADGGAV